MQDQSGRPDPALVSGSPSSDTGAATRRERSDNWARLRRALDLAGQRLPRTDRAASMQWILGHLPITATVAAMGAAMVSLVDQAHAGRTPAATAWVLCAGAAVVLGATILLVTTLQAWDRGRGLYRPLARAGAAVAAACLVLGAARPAPLVLGLALVVLLSIPGGLAVARKLAGATDSPAR